MNIKIFVKIVYNKESFEGKTETEIKEYFNEKIKSINKTNKGESDLCKNSKMLYVRSKNDWKR